LAFGNKKKKKKMAILVIGCTVVYKKWFELNTSLNFGFNIFLGKLFGVWAGPYSVPTLQCQA